MFCSPVPDVEEVQLYVGVEPGDSIRRRQVLVALQDDGVDQGYFSGPVARVLRVGDDLIDVASVDSDRTVSDFELEDLVRVFGDQPGVFVLRVEDETLSKDLQDVVG